MPTYMTMSRRNRINWEPGDLFVVPLVDGSFGIVQVIDRWMPRWVYAAVTDQRMASSSLATPVDRNARVIALIAVSDEEFDFGAFPRIGPAPAMAHRKDFPNERYALTGYVGAKSYTGAVVADFLSAWHGLTPWTTYKDPAYFDQLLMNGVERPPHAVGGK
jgi:hypothetical protein